MIILVLGLVIIFIIASLLIKAWTQAELNNLK